MSAAFARAAGDRRPGEAERGALLFGLSPAWAAQRWLLGAVALLVAANLVTLFGWTLPRWRQAAAVQAVSRQGQRAEATLGPTLARARRSYGRVLEAEREVAALRRVVRERAGTVAELVATLRAAVDRAGLRADRIGYQAEPVAELGLTRIAIDLPVRGTYRQLRALLERLLHGPGFLVIERIAASRPPDEADGEGLQMQLVMSAFLAPAGAQDAVGAPAGGPDAAGAVAGGQDAAPIAGQGAAAGGGGRAPAGEAPGALPAGVDPVTLARQLSEQLASLPEIDIPDEQLALDLTPLEAALPAGAPVRRNPFAFRRTAALAAAEPVVQIPSPPAPAPPVMPYQLVGITRTERGRLATFARDDDVFLLGEGDTLPEGYRVHAIGIVNAELEAGDEIVRLRLGDTEPVERRSLQAQEDSAAGAGARASRRDKTDKADKADKKKKQRKQRGQGQ